MWWVEVFSMRNVEAGVCKQSGVYTVAIIRRNQDIKLTYFPYNPCIAVTVEYREMANILK
jgi:hypothetical protein